MKIKISCCQCANEETFASFDEFRDYVKVKFQDKTEYHMNFHLCEDCLNEEEDEQFDKSEQDALWDFSPEQKKGWL